LRGIVNHGQPALEQLGLDGILHLVQVVSAVSGPDLQLHRQSFDLMRQCGEEIRPRAHLADDENRFGTSFSDELLDALGDGTHILARGFLGTQLWIAVASGLRTRRLVHRRAPAVDSFRMQLAVGVHGDVGTGVIDCDQ
jgi:hypothetical protein